MLEEAKKHPLFCSEDRMLFWARILLRDLLLSFARWGVVHSTRTLPAEAASQMLAAAGQSFPGLITTKPPVEKNSEGLWGKRWGWEGLGRRGEGGGIKAFENSPNPISLLDLFMVIFIWHETTIYNAFNRIGMNKRMQKGFIQNFLS